MSDPDMRATDIELVEIGIEPGVTLRGHLWPGSVTWIVLLHDAGSDDDLDCWQSLVPMLRHRGWSVLAVDLRGHGASDGEWDADQAGGDLAAIIGAARMNGAARVFLVTAGSIGLVALSSAAVTQPDALVLLSPVIGESDETTPYRGSGQSRLFISGGVDSKQRLSAERLRNSAIGWAAVLNLPTDEPGAALLAGPYGAHAREHICGFLAEQDFIVASRSCGRRDHKTVRAEGEKERSGA